MQEGEKVGARKKRPLARRVLVPVAWLLILAVPFFYEFVAPNPSGLIFILLILAVFGSAVSYLRIKRFMDLDRERELRRPPPRKYRR